MPAESMVAKPSMKPSVCIIILNWNTVGDTLACLKSLDRTTHSNFKVVVVDNGSSNDSVEILSKIENIKFISNKKNLGFTGGNNIAIRYAVDQRFDYVWLLNSDATVEPECLEKLINSATSSDRIGMVSPVIYHQHSPETIQHCGSRLLDLNSDGVEETIDIPTASRWQEETPANMILWGTAMLISIELIRTIGYLDDKLFAYSEDTDYSIRSCNAGYRNLTVFDARIWHASTDAFRKPHFYYYKTRNVGLMWRKHTGLFGFARICWWNFNRTKQLLTKLQARPELAAACMMGFWDGLRNTGGEFDPTRKVPLGARALFGRI